MSILKPILIPFSALYGLGVGIRNFLFDTGVLKSRSFKIPVLCIGNITVGGTGKTPHTELLIDTLRKDFRVACLSRGYKRKSSGFVLATAASTAAELGDEPLQIHRKFPDILVACDADRVRGIERLSALPEPPEVIVLDDAFQHRYVKAGKNIVLIDYHRPVNKDCLLPAGRLRERSSALKRADYLIVTKCPPTLSPIERRIFYKHLKIKPYQKLFFTRIGYGSIQSLDGTKEAIPADKECGILCVTGIAQPAPYIEHLKGITPKVSEMRYPDHHAFTPRDLEEIVKKFQALPEKKKYILTTEKDAMRLSSVALPEELKKHIRYIPIVPEFIKDQETFFTQIVEYVRKNQK